MSENYSTDSEAIRGHYLTRGPSVIIGITTVIAAVVLLAFAITELRHASQNQSSLSIVTGDNPAAGNVPVLNISQQDWTLNHSPISESDLLFRLSGLSATSQGVIIEYDQNVPVNTLTDALNQVNQAGFTQIALKEADTSSSSMQK